MHWLKRLLLPAFLAGGVVCGAWVYHRQYGEAPPAYRTTPVTRGELLQVITASGQLNPVTMVDVGSQISGIIKELLADFNSTVTQRQVIARIDPASYEASFLQAEGNLANARAALELGQVEEQRAMALRKDKLNTQADYDRALAVLHEAEATVKIKEGALKSAQVDLERCTIYSPIDGLVLSRNVNVGQTVAASLSAPTLFVIANDLTKMQIDANIAEADIGVVEVGQDANCTVDAFPGRTFHGKVRQIRNSPRTEQNVVTYATIIEVANPDLKLKPGMTANVSVIVARRADALRIPNAALRFRPAERSVTAKAGPETKVQAPGKRDAESKPQGGQKEQRALERVVYAPASQSSATNSSASGGLVEVLQPVPIRTGINNAAFTEVVEGLKEGDDVVIGLASPKARASGASNPLAKSPPRR